MKKQALAILLIAVGMLIGAGGCKRKQAETLSLDAPIPIVPVVKDVKEPRHYKPEQEKPKPKHDKLGAWTITQDFVETKLACPHRTKWPWVSYEKATNYLGNGRYQCSSFVYIKNTYGVKTRIYFVCVVEHISGSKWRLVKLII